MMNELMIERILNLPAVKAELDAQAAASFEERQSHIAEILDADESFKTRVSLGRTAEAKLRIKEISAEETLKQIRDELATTRRAILDGAYRHKNFADLAWQEIEATADPRLARFIVWADGAKNAIQYHSHVRGQHIAQSFGFSQKLDSLSRAIALCIEARSWAIAARRQALTREDLTYKIASFIESISNASPDANIPRFDVEA